MAVKRTHKKCLHICLKLALVCSHTSIRYCVYLMYKAQLSATEYTLVSGLHRSGSELAVLCVTLETPASSTGGYRLELNRQGF